MPSVKVGDQAPDFTRVASDGRTVTLSEFRARQCVVLFFYPRSGTRICTQEACAFRDTYEDFVEAGAAVIGVSSDSDKSHANFAAKHQLPYYLISDGHSSLRRLFGVPKTLGFLPGRTTYVIDKQGVVRHITNVQLAPQQHIDDALQAVRDLSRVS